ncbi:UNVERIFIED_CONTAM: hypothetical protein RMT77_012473 [Armadillidium vulgare]
MEPKQDKIGYYFVKQNIDLLKVRVILKEYSTIQLLKKSFSEFRKNSMTSSIDLEQFAEREKNGQGAFSENVVIKWQEKLLSPFEKEKYCKSTFKKNEEFSEYHTKAQQSKKQRRTRIFTYVQKDEFRTEIVPPTNSRRENSSKELCHRFGAMDIRGEEENDLVFHIMVDLCSDESYGKTSENEFILCKLKYRSNGQLTIDPDFSKSGTKPNRIYGVDISNSIYEYKIQLFSETKKDIGLEDAKPSLVSNKSASEFDIVTSFDVRLEYNGEITRATNFTESSSPLYIYYQLHLPEGWETEEGNVGDGVSESCVPFYNDNRTPVCHFSFPLNFSLRKTSKATEWPCLLFFAFTNEWLRHDKDVGFGAIGLPYPGSSDESKEIEVRTWRPSSESIYDWLRGIFLGGVRLLKDLSYLVPTGRKESYVNRLGFRTESSGSIWLRLHSMVQINKDLAGDEMPDREVETSYYHPSTFAVICAFQKSFIRLKSIKKNLQIAKGIGVIHNE